jgi:hypothetical protein
MLLRPVPTLCSVALAVLAMGGCRSTATTELMRQEAQYDIQVGDYAKAVPKLNDLYDCVQAGEPDSEGASPASADDIAAADELLWRMERGTIDTLRGDALNADLHLKRAAQLVDERRTKSVAREVATYVANDTVREFDGKGYEHTQVDYGNAISSLVQAERRLGLIASITMVERIPGGILAPETSPQLPESVSTDSLVNRAFSNARRMVIDNIKYNKDNNPDLRYFDDPYARLFAAALVFATPPDLRANDDDNFAYGQIRRAARIYAEQFGTFGGDGKLRYEVKRVPDLLVRLGVQLTRRFDPQGLGELLKTCAVQADDARVAKADLPAGHGMVLLLNHADYITPTNALSIDLKVNIPWQPTLTEAERQRGITITPFTALSSTFYAKGPGSEIAAGWGPAVAVVADIASLFGKVTPGTWIAFEVPAHRPDAPIPAPGVMTVDGQDAEPLEVLCDLDAYARATLRDEQPGILTKTIIRSMTKHVAAEAAGQAAQEAVKDQGLAMQLLACLSTVGMHAAASASESADTRHWTTLPDRIEGSLAYLPAGQHAIGLRTAGGSREIATIDVPAGRLVIVPARSWPKPMPRPVADK